MPCLVQQAACGDRVVALEVRVPGRSEVVLCAITRDGPRTGLLPRGGPRAHWRAKLPPGIERRREREGALEGAEIVSLGDTEVFLLQHGDPRVLRPHGTRLVVTDAPGKASGRDLAELLEDDVARTALEARGAEIAAALAVEGLSFQRDAFVKLLETAKKRLERRREAIQADLARISDADKIAAQAQWLVAEAARAKRGATKLVVTDWSSGEAVPMEIPLDPSKSAREQVEAMFRRAKRLRLGARIAEQRLAHTETQHEAVVRAIERVRASETLEEMEDAASEAKRAAPREVVLPQGSAAPAPRGAKTATGRSPYRTFLATSGTKILVGKGASDNDALTTKMARPHDLWLHAKDRTGAHVIVVLPKGHTCASQDLVDAAHLAAHFSDVRDEKVVDIQYAPRRHVRKPKGSPPGFVLVDREKVLVLRVEPERLRGLLEREDL